jgi:hypothetical protein
MRTLAIVLIVAGLLMIVVRGFNLATEKKIIDAGPLQVNKKENHWIGWPTYAGAAVSVAGVFLLLASKKGRG